jgi:hypothetical protein
MNAPEEHKTMKRLQIAELMSEYKELSQKSLNHSQIAQELGIPRSTLQHWLDRRNSINEDPAVIEFFESPAGTAYLHRLVLAAHHIMTLVGPCGVRQVCQYLELTGLDQFVASSHSAQHNVSIQLEQAAAAYAQEEQARLAETMEPRQITVCQDETFHPETCLVAIEPVSNFILLEAYSESRTAQDWTDAMQAAVQGLPVDIIQSVSDEGTGILSHVKNALGAHHSPDVFHVQNEIVKGTSAALAAKTRCAARALDNASTKVIRCIEKKAAYMNNKQGAGRPPEFDKRIEAAQKIEDEARQALESAAACQERAQNAVRQIGEVYHPVNLETGVLNKPEEVAEALEQCFSDITAAATEASLSERCVSKIKKAKKVVTGLVATIVFVLLTIQAKVGNLCLRPEVEKAVFENLIPAAYIQLAAKKARCAEDRARLNRKAEELLAPLSAPDGLLTRLEPAERGVIERVVDECAGLFQRSSSCVEGRNGQLSLRHHGFHRLSIGKLAALTAVHNFWLKRKDGTCAAERFFGVKPRDMFEYLLSRVDLPGWPARKKAMA